MQNWTCSSIIQYNSTQKHNSSFTLANAVFSLDVFPVLFLGVCRLSELGFRPHVKTFCTRALIQPAGTKPILQLQSQEKNVFSIVRLTMCCKVPFCWQILSINTLSSDDTELIMFVTVQHLLTWLFWNPLCLKIYRCSWLLLSYTLSNALINVQSSFYLFL